MTILQEKAKAAVKRYGGVRKAAKALRIDYSLLSRLQDGKRTSASERTLRALGVERTLRAL